VQSLILTDPSRLATLATLPASDCGGWRMLGGSGKLKTEIAVRTTRGVRMQTLGVRTSALKTFFAHCGPATWPMVSLVGLLLVWSLPSAAQSTPPEGVIQSERRIVLVNVIAKDKHGKPVEDLRRDDFGLLDNNQEQRGTTPNRPHPIPVPRLRSCRGWAGLLRATSSARLAP